MPLPVVPLDSTNEKQHRTIIATVLNELAKQAPASGSWTPVIRGSGTAGTYEILTNNCRYTRIGRRVWLDLYIEMAAIVTGGGTGFLQINGVPYAKSANTLPQGNVLLAGLDWAAGANLSLSWIDTASTSSLLIKETNDNAATSNVQIAGIAASDIIAGSICYETDDP